MKDLSPGIDLLLGPEVFAPEPLGQQHLLLAGGRVAWIGPEPPDLPAELGVRRRDLSGRRLVPGLIDLHAHLSGGGGEAGFASRVPALSAHDFLRGGITTALGLLGTDDLVRTTAEVLATARGMREEGLDAYCYTGGYHLPPTTLTGSVRSDLVHLDPVLAVGELAISDHRSSQPTLDELLRIASEAHVAGMMSGKPGFVHLHLGDGPRGLELVRQALQQSELPPAVFQPTHVNRRKGLFEEACELAREGVPIDATAFPVEDGEDAWSAERAFELALEAAVPAKRFTISSDGGGCLPRFDADQRIVGWGVGQPDALVETLRALLQRGHPLERALLPFTSSAAGVLRMADRGRIAVGARADLVALDVEHAITDVIAAGRWHLRGGERVTRGAFEAD